MKDFLAVNSKQLGVCLKMFYAEGISPAVKVIETNKGKINYLVSANIDDTLETKLRERYRILIS